MQSGWALGYILARCSRRMILGFAPLGDDAWRWLFVARRPAGVLHALDPPLRARAGDLDASGRPPRTRRRTRSR